MPNRTWGSPAWLSTSSMGPTCVSSGTKSVAGGSTRGRIIDKTDPEYGAAIPMFLEKYGDPVVKAVKDFFPKVEEVFAYAEWFGPHSFAGWHDPVSLGVEKNEPMQLVLFDVSILRKGFMGPEEFLKMFGHLHVPEVVYTGDFTEQFIADVRQGKFPVHEGVVCKGGFGHKLWMRKVKTNQYLKELKEKFPDRWINFWE